LSIKNKLTSGRTICQFSICQNKNLASFGEERKTRNVRQEFSKTNVNILNPVTPGFPLGIRLTRITSKLSLIHLSPDKSKGNVL
jgi:hypothetical protein